MVEVAAHLPLVPAPPRGQPPGPAALAFEDPVTQPRYATIDVGTNTVLLLVAERQPDGTFRAIDERMEITRLGRGVDRTKRLDPQAIADTVSAVARFAQAARAADVHGLVVTATSAARDAQNGRDFFDAALAAAGVPVEVIPGDTEAELAYESAWRDFGQGAANLAVVDIGGGSTELVYGVGEQHVFARSFDVGAVRLTERWLHADPPAADELLALRRDLAAVLAEAPPPPAGAALVGIAGTVTTLVAIHLGLDAYDGALVHGRTLTAGEVRDLATRLGRMSLGERRALPGLPEKRADVIVAGAEILAAVLEKLGFAQVIASDRGVRWGMLYRRFG